MTSDADRLLSACADWPHARLTDLRPLALLRRDDGERAVRHLVQSGLVVISQVGGEGRVRRLAPTEAGQKHLGRAVAESVLVDAYLGSARLDVARRLLTEALLAGALTWSLSPFRLPLQALTAMAGPRRTRIRGARPRPLVPLVLDGLADVQLHTTHRHVTLALVVDPGDLNADWCLDTLRAFKAWVCRPEFRAGGRTRPVLVWVAANARRLETTLQLWRQAAWHGGGEATLRIAPWAALVGQADQRRWISGHGLAGPLWNSLNGQALPSGRPPAHIAAWWG
jgi:DNA-binding MarR family transcriptional regulator